MMPKKSHFELVNGRMIPLAKDFSVYLTKVEPNIKKHHQLMFMDSEYDYDYFVRRL